MARTSVSAVRTILPAGSALTTPQIQSAIDAATCTVDKIADDCDLTCACLQQVEKYTAAHFAAVTENTLSVKSEKDPCCGGSATYGFEFGEGIKGTPFGQMANTLSGGCLAELDKQPVGLYSIGCH